MTLRWCVALRYERAIVYILLHIYRERDLQQRRIVIGPVYVSRQSVAFPTVTEAPSESED